MQYVEKIVQSLKEVSHYLH